MRTSDPPVIVDERFDAPLEVVWAAITVPEQMRDWFVAYGVPLNYLQLEPGSGAPDLMLLILITGS